MLLICAEHTYMYTYIHTYIHTKPGGGGAGKDGLMLLMCAEHIYIHTCIYIHTYVHTYIHTYIHTHTTRRRRCRQGRFDAINMR
jgi:hypothetical protein